MNTFTRPLVLALTLCLGVSLCAWAKTEDSATNSSSAASSPESKSAGKGSENNKSKSKSAGKDSGKAKKKAEPNGEGSARKRPAKASSDGFRGLGWGAPLSALREPDLREKDADMAYYTVPADDMDVMGVTMREVVYVFCKGKLAGALTRYDGELNHLALQGKLGETYGTPLQSPPNLRGDRSWRYDHQDTSVMMEYAATPGTGALAFMAKDRLAVCQGPPLDAAPAADQGDAAAAAKSGDDAKPRKSKSKAKSSENKSGKKTGQTSGKNTAKTSDKPL